MSDLKLKKMPVLGDISPILEGLGEIFHLIFLFFAAPGTQKFLVRLRPGQTGGVQGF